MIPWARGEAMASVCPGNGATRYSHLIAQTGSRGGSALTCPLTQPMDEGLQKTKGTGLAGGRGPFPSAHPGAGVGCQIPGARLTRRAPLGQSSPCYAAGRSTWTRITY